MKLLIFITDILFCFNTSGSIECLLVLLKGGNNSLFIYNIFEKDNVIG